MTLEVEHLSSTYRPERSLFYDANFVFEQGQALSILEVDGVGKSTLFNCIADLLPPQREEIRLHGAPLSRLELWEISRIIDYTPQNHTPAYDYTVQDFVVMGRAPHLGAFQQSGRADYDLADATLEEMGPLPLASRPYTELSGGERQQVTIIQVIAQRSELILLGEPTNHLDYGNQLRAPSMVRTLMKWGFGVIMTGHNPDHILLPGGQVGILGNDGRLLVGNAEEIVTEKRSRALCRNDFYLIYAERAGRKICIPGRLKPDEQEDRVESIEALGEGKPFPFRFDEMLNYYGLGFPDGAVHGLKVMQKVFPLLDDGNLLERREISFVTALPGPGAQDAFELVTRCFTDSRYMVDKKLLGVTNELESPGGRYCFRSSCRERFVVVMLRPGHVWKEFTQPTCKRGYTEVRERTLAGVKHDVVIRLVAVKAEDTYQAERS